VDSHPPERIELPGLLLRRSRLDDAGLVADAVAAELERLADWMAWAGSDAASVEVQRERMRDVVRDWDQGRAFEYLAVSPETGAHYGNFGIERRAGAGALDLGYWLGASATGRGRATTASRALTEVALALPGIERVEIHCDEANERSRRVPQRLGYRLDRIDPVPITARAETGRRMIWVYP
jgi:RimJ/RimL family protein N-acetyltransferase